SHQGRTGPKSASRSVTNDKGQTWPATLFTFFYRFVREFVPWSSPPARLSIESIRSHMTDQPPSDRFKTDMPQIPGVSGSGSRSYAASKPAVKLVVGLLSVLLVVFLGARWALRSKHVEPPLAVQRPALDVHGPACDPRTLVHP